VLAISRVDTVWININVPDDDLPYVRAGSPVSFSSSSLPGKSFSATIGTVNAVPTTGTLSYLARVQMVNPGDVLRGGMLVTASVPKESRSSTIVVPRTAVAQSDKGDIVYVVGKDSKAEAVPVRVGIQTDTEAEVLSSAIQPGTKVITTRPDALKDGSVVAINSSGGQ
jgi:RND family efflux transporter MFP subunit